MTGLARLQRRIAKGRPMVHVAQLSAKSLQRQDGGQVLMWLAVYAAVSTVAQ
jgi:hypothetical protein